MPRLLEDEYDLVLGLMIDFAVQGAGDMVIKELVPDHVRPDLPTGAVSTRHLATKALDLCDQKGAAALLCIVNYLIDNAGYGAQLGPVRTRLMAPRPASQHPMEAKILQSGLPFANREPLRGMLRQMVDPGAFRQVLHVSGDPGTGKSWIYFLIEHFCAQNEGHVPCYYPVSEDSGRTAGPKEVAKDLVAQLGGDSTTAPEQMANQDAYVIDLAHWVLAAANGIANAPDARVWFVFDGFSRTALRPDTAKLLMALSRLCTTGINARRHRVVFCELEHNFSAGLQMRVATYRTEPIIRDDLRDVIRAQAALRPGLTQEEIEVVVEALTDSVIGDENEPFTDLTGIGQRLIDTLVGAQSYG